MIYLLHFSTKFKHAGHYIGFVEDGGLEERLARHRAGRGATLLKHVTGASITFVLARTWEGDRKLERRIKKHGGASRICPICSSTALNRAKFQRRKPK